MSIQDILGKPQPAPMDGHFNADARDQPYQTASPAHAASPEAIVARMMALIAGQIAGMEAKIKEDGLMNDTELRQLDAMSKTIEKLIALDKASAKGAPESAKIDPELAIIRDRLIARVRSLDTK